MNEKENEEGTVWAFGTGRVRRSLPKGDTLPGFPDALRGALTMIYRVVTYDRTTERMRGSLVVPPSVSGKIKKIAGFKPQDDGLGEYPLDERQTRQVAQVLGVPTRAGAVFLLRRTL
jgi:hypothetical protein